MNGVKEESLLFLLLAHHERENLDRTIRVNLLGRDLYLCARCTGKYAGEATALLSLLLDINPPVWPCLLIMLLFPVPAIVDWVTQRLGRRESTNPVRVLTGYLLGIALGIWGLLLIRGLLIPFLLGVIITIAYLSLIFSIYRISGRPNKELL